jgi:Family of unknown function (DUF6352)
VPDFWRSSGFHLLRRDAAGRLAVTDDFLRAYLARPELRPSDDGDISCPAERALHAALILDPRRPVAPEELAALAEPDARRNYEVLLRFRDRLVGHGTVEAAYLGLLRASPAAAPAAAVVPPLFVDQLAHAILRGILDGCGDALRVRAAELLFRSQRVSIQGNGSIMVADEEVVGMRAAAGESLAALAGEAAAPRRGTVELDVLDDAGAATYWALSDRFDTVLDVGFTRPGLDALCRVLEAWVAHFTGGVAVSVQPVRSVRDERWSWHVGLDAVASGILNDLYEGHDVPEERLALLLALFRLEFRDPDAMLPRVRGRPVYLGMAMTPGGVLRLKPQNLLVNLPLAGAV